MISGNGVAVRLYGKPVSGLRGAPQYTRPPEFEGMKVPEILLTGHHKKIEEWKAEQSRQRTKKNRPDLLE